MVDGRVFVVREDGSIDPGVEYVSYNKGRVISLDGVFYLSDLKEIVAHLEKCIPINEWERPERVGQ